MPSVDALIWIAFTVGVPAALAIHYMANARRASVMRRFAAESGFDFEAEDPSLERLGLTRLPILAIGKSRRFLHVLRGETGGREVLVFDYRHRVGGVLTSMTHDSLLADAALGIEKNRKPTWYNMTVVALRAPKVAEPSRVRVPDLPGGHTRLERAGEWLALYRFDRRAPVGELHRLVRHALEAADRAESDA